MASIEVKAEWPGRVAEIQVAVGDRVEPEQELLTIESMKMLTPVPAPEGGTVASIAVQVDQYVDEGAKLLELTTD